MENGVSPVEWSIDGSSPVNTMRCGIGACWHAIEVPSLEKYAGSSWGGNPAAENEAAWRRLYELADWTGMSFLRVEVSQRMYEPRWREFTWDSPEMLILCRILDWCQSRGATVFLQQQYNNVEWNAFPECRNDETGVLRSAPYSLDDFTHGIVSLVEFLVRQRGYDCIRYLGLNNEPHPWCCWAGPGGKQMPMLPALESVCRELSARELSVVLAGPDLVEGSLSGETDAMARYLGAFEVHVYGGAFDWRTDHAFDWCYPMREGVEKFGQWADYAHDRGKPFFLGEMGTFDYGMGGSRPEPGSYAAVLKDMEYALRLMNAGVDGFCRWSFVNRGNIDGQWQLVDTWDGGNNRLRKVITPHPNSFLLWGMLSRFVSGGATVLHGAVSGGSDGKYQRVFGTAVDNPDGSRALILVNDADAEVSAHVRCGHNACREFYRYRIDMTHCDSIDVCAELQGTVGEGFTGELSPMSLTVYSTRLR
jgi:hypothetical protein